jgi:hypothetical protein
MGASTPFIMMAASTAMSMQQARNQAKAENAAAAAQPARSNSARRSRSGAARSSSPHPGRPAGPAGAAASAGRAARPTPCCKGLTSEAERELDDVRRANLLRIDDIYGTLSRTRKRNLLDARAGQLNSLFGGAARA